MCGIVGGIIEKKDLLPTLKIAWDRMFHRGFHGYSVIILGKKWRTYKALDIDSLFNLIIEDFDKIPDRFFFIGHNRWATTGETYDLKATHPIISTHWIVIQNGTKKDLLDFVKDTDHDTRAIAKLLNIIKVNELEKFGEYFLDETGVVFGFHRELDVMFMHRDNTRSLFYNKELKLFASEPIFKGTWHLVPKVKIKVVNYGEDGAEFFDANLDDFMLGHGETIHKVVINNIRTVTRVAKCSKCKKTRILVKDGKCALCLINEKYKKTKEELKKKHSEVRYVYDTRTRTTKKVRVTNSSNGNNDTKISVTVSDVSRSSEKNEKGNSNSNKRSNMSRLV